MCDPRPITESVTSANVEMRVWPQITDPVITAFSSTCTPGPSTEFTMRAFGLITQFSPITDALSICAVGEVSGLVFYDQRHFVLMKIVGTADLAKAKEISKLAPEPFSDAFSPAYLADRVRSSSRPLKEILLDQTKVCGVGNIYASEAMFLAKINPKNRGRSISRTRCVALHENIKSVLQEAIDLAATIEPHPKFIGEGVYGNGSETRWRVYDREGLPCIACGTTIKRITQSGRSTYYCSKCQR